MSAVHSARLAPFLEGEVLSKKDLSILICKRETSHSKITRKKAAVAQRQFEAYLNPKSMYNNSPKPIITDIKAIILHTFGVQVGV